MQVRYDCPTDGCVAIIEYAPLEECGATMKCPRCSVEHPMHISEAMRTQGLVDQCAVCAGKELFVRKDFPQGIGMLVVVVFGLAAIYFFSQSSLLTAWGILASAILIDFLIYRLIGHVTACYACRAEYRQYNPSDENDAFDLATSEKY